MKIFGVGSFTAGDMEGYAIPPAWRKATRNMILATASQERALAGLPEIARADMGLVLGSVSGELDTSVDFLATLAKSGLARPLLFQNSLHNATTGFSTIHFRLGGPSFTVSASERTPGECVRLAGDLIRLRHCALCLVTIVEGHKNTSGLLGESVGEGAASVVLGNMVGPKAVAELDDSWLEDYPTAPGTPLVDPMASRFFTNVRALEA